MAEIARWTACVALGVLLVSGGAGTAGRRSASLDHPIVFVSRQIPAHGSIYWEEAHGLAGVGPFSRVQNASPGRLQVREPDGTIRTLVDGAAPGTPAIVDVSSADVSYDGTQLVFAGLLAGAHDRASSGNPGAWRLFVVAAAGGRVRQITFDDDRADLPPPLRPFDDYDPAWLPDGRIVFASTRYPSFAQYGGVRTSNLYVIDGGGGALHRITTERNGADRPAVDPVTGEIVFARWWRNHRFPVDRMDARAGGRGPLWKDGLSSERDTQLDGSPAFASLLWRNAWHLARIRPDGTGLAMWGGATGAAVDDERNHAYGGAFDARGVFYANFFPMYNMTEAAGFGGIRRFGRGPGASASIAGVTRLSTDYARSTPPSFGIYPGEYLTDAVPLPGGGLLASRAATIAQDYGLVEIDAAGTVIATVYDAPGTAETRAVLLAPRPRPPILRDAVTTPAAERPPAARTAAGPFTGDGTFAFEALNVYFNAPVDTPIGPAPPVGSAATIRFFIDHQRGSFGSYPEEDWPILLKELPVGVDGAVRDPAAPANVPLFEQLRDAEGRVPRLGPAAAPTAAAHVAGLNYGRPGTVMQCVGCHAGHTMIPVPRSRAAARWTNLAPGAAVAVSSSRDPGSPPYLIDRLARRADPTAQWQSADGRIEGQWITLTLPVPVHVRSVRVYRARPAADAAIDVGAVTVRLYADAAAASPVATCRGGAVRDAGTDVHCGDAVARTVRVELDAVRTAPGATGVSLGEIEVIAAPARRASRP